MDEYSKLRNFVILKNPSVIELLDKTYYFAKSKHQGQYRESGEEYIIHPVFVANILASWNADIDTIIAGLLHDILEDTNTSNEEIKELFGSNVLNLVLGVTNLSKMSFYNKNELEIANLRKIILGMVKDVRIILIKLADRLHNMETLNYKYVEKQQKKALETMEIYVPLARILGMYNIKCRLEDLCLYYLKPNEYKKIFDKRCKIEEVFNKSKEDIINIIYTSLKSNNIDSVIKFRLKSIYSIYKKLSKGYVIEDLKDLYIFRTIVGTFNECYLSLGCIHDNFKPLNNGFVDYIASPLGVYQAIHTNILGDNDKKIQVQIQTKEMEKRSLAGITLLWDNKDNNISDVIKKYEPLFTSISEINESSSNNLEFIEQIKGEVLAKKMIIYDDSGKEISIQTGSTVIDFAYYLHSDIAKYAVGALVDGKFIPLNETLKPNSKVKIIFDYSSLGPKKEWENIVRTRSARKKINEELNKKGNI